jgi:tripartite-type tricarboxylate transporter receptor subunit TctC
MIMTGPRLDRRRLLAAALGAAAVQTMSSRCVLAQTIDRPSKLLVGAPAGGSIDTVARLLVEQMKGYAPSLIVENRAGAGGRIALDALRRSEADGATLALSPGDLVTLFPHVYRTLAYAPLRDFVPVTTVCSFPFVFVVGPMVPPDVRSLAEFAAWCRANPQRAAYGSAGAGTRPHFLGALLARETKVEMTHVPFVGGAPALQATLGSQIPATVTVLGNALPQLSNGGLRALAITATKRSASLPEVPTVRDAGFPALEAVEWFGIFAPSATPSRLVGELEHAVGAALGTPKVQEAFGKLAFEVSSVRGEAFARLIRDDTEYWRRVVAESGFTPLD